MRDVAGLVEGAGAGLIFIGAYVPWVMTFAVFTSLPVRGVDTDYGRIVPLIPLLGLGLVAWRWYKGRTWWVHLFIVALGAFTIVLALLYTVGVKRTSTLAQESLAGSRLALPGAVRVRFDVGLYLTVTGGRRNARWRPPGDQ